MKHYQVRFLLVFGMTFGLLASDLLAQPRPSNRHGDSRSKILKKSPPPSSRHDNRQRGNDRNRRADNVDKKTNPRVCSMKRAMVDREQRQLDLYQSELTGIDSEIVQLKRRLSELDSRRRDVLNQKNRSEARYKTRQNEYAEVCEAQDNCQQYQGFIQDIQNERKRLGNRLDSLRNDMTRSSRTISRLESRIEPLRREYTRKGCDDLVAGETDQRTIDRCTSIFSEWNRLQVDLNNEYRELNTSKTEYEQIWAQLENTEQRNGTYVSYVAQNCRDRRGRPVKIIDDYRRVRDRAKKVGDRLDKLIDDVSRLRGLKITVSAH